MPGGSNGDSMNFFTIGFSHDWSISEGMLRISGEDHYTALKAPKTKLRCKRMTNWAYEKYPYLEK